MALMNLQFGTVTIRSKCFIHSSIFHHFFSGIKWLILPNIFCNSFALINSYDLAWMSLRLLVDESFRLFTRLSLYLHIFTRPCRWCDFKPGTKGWKNIPTALFKCYLNRTWTQASASAKDQSGTLTCPNRQYSYACFNTLSQVYRGRGELLKHSDSHLLHLQSI